jgi:DNA-binding response OmpR family regulator
MIVDDEYALRELLRQMLELAGYAVIEAVHGDDALIKLEETLPDAMILDVMMPQMDGITLCKHLRADSETADLPIIMLSGKTQKSAIEEGLAAGANCYLCKPVSFDELISNLRQVLPKATAVS